MAMKTTAFLAALFLSAAALAAPSDNWITFGLDHGKYLDGETIAEGEEFSLVWTDEASVTNEVMRLSLAEDGFCPTTLFNVTPAKTGGRFLFYQQDSRGTGSAGAKLVATAEVATGRVVAAEPVKSQTPCHGFRVRIAAPKIEAKKQFFRIAVNLTADL